MNQLQSGAHYKWVKQSKSKWAYDLKTDGHTLAQFNFPNETSSKAWASFNGNSVTFKKSVNIFSQSITINDEISGMRVCQIRNLKWYDMAKGTIEFEDSTIYSWQIDNHPQVSFTIYDQEGIQVLEYQLNSDYNRYEISVSDKPINKNILLLLLVIGWYSSPKLNTVEYAERDSFLNKLELAF